MTLNRTITKVLLAISLSCGLAFTVSAQLKPSVKEIGPMPPASVVYIGNSLFITTTACMATSAIW